MPAVKTDLGLLFSRGFGYQRDRARDPEMSTGSSGPSFTDTDRDNPAHISNRDFIPLLPFISSRPAMIGKSLRIRTSLHSSSVTISVVPASPSSFPDPTGRLNLGKEGGFIAHGLHLSCDDLWTVSDGGAREARPGDGRRTVPPPWIRRKWRSRVFRMHGTVQQLGSIKAGTRWSAEARYLPLCLSVYRGTDARQA